MHVIHIERAKLSWHRTAQHYSVLSGNDRDEKIPMSHLHGHQLVALLLEARDDLSHELPLDAIGLDGLRKRTRFVIAAGHAGCENMSRAVARLRPVTCHLWNVNEIRQKISCSALLAKRRGPTCLRCLEKGSETTR